MYRLIENTSEQTLFAKHAIQRTWGVAIFFFGIFITILGALVVFFDFIGLGIMVGGVFALCLGLLMKHSAQSFPDSLAFDHIDRNLNIRHHKKTLLIPYSVLLDFVLYKPIGPDDHAKIVLRTKYDVFFTLLTFQSMKKAEEVFTALKFINFDSGVDVNKLILLRGSQIQEQNSGQELRFILPKQNTASQIASIVCVAAFFAVIGLILTNQYQSIWFTLGAVAAALPLVLFMTVSWLKTAHKNLLIALDQGQIQFGYLSSKNTEQKGRIQAKLKIKNLLDVKSLLYYVSQQSGNYGRLYLADENLRQKIMQSESGQFAMGEIGSIVYTTLKSSSIFVATYDVIDILFVALQINQYLKK